MKWIKTTSQYLITAIFLAGLAGCQSPGVRDGAGQDGDQVQGAELQGGFDIKSLDDPDSPLSRRVIYFELDSASISKADRGLVAAHASFLAANPQISVILEGHADERGTREYNIALGERRAKAVRQLMSLQGVVENQAQVISFGEERPISMEHNEEGWRLNRRVEILYSGY